MAGRAGRLALYLHLAGAQRRHHRFATVQAVARAFREQSMAARAHVRPAVEREEEVRPRVRGLGTDQVNGIEQLIDLAADQLLLFDKHPGKPVDRLLVLQHQSPAIDVGASKNLGDVTGLVTLRQDGGDRVWITLRRLQSGALGDQPVADHFASKAIFIVAPVRSHSVETDHEGGFARGAREVAGYTAGVLAIKDPLDRDASQAPTDLSSESRAEFQETLLRLNRLVMAEGAAAFADRKPHRFHIWQEEPVRHRMAHL